MQWANSFATTHSNNELIHFAHPTGMYACNIMDDSLYLTYLPESISGTIYFGTRRSQYVRLDILLPIQSGMAIPKNMWVKGRKRDIRFCTAPKYCCRFRDQKNAPTPYPSNWSCKMGWKPQTTLAYNLEPLLNQMPGTGVLFPNFELSSQMLSICMKWVTPTEVNHGRDMNMFPGIVFA